MLKLGVYIRVSSDRFEQKSSLENQKELFIQYAEQNNYRIEKFYTDIDSGTKLNRPALQQLIADVKDKKFDVIVSKELSRLARNGELSYKLKSIAELHGVHLVTLDGAINTITGNWDLFGLYAWIYENEAAATSDRLKKMLKTRAMNGLFNGSIAPLGYYCKEGKLYIRNDNTPDVVKRIFAEYISGKGIDSIARDLTKDNVKTPSEVAGKKNAGSVWHGKTIKKILTNKAYIGSIEQIKESTTSVVSKKRIKNDDSQIILVENTHEAIISKETFYIVQDLLKSRHKERGHQAKHLFTNLLRCADCGKGMHFKKNRKGYVCGTSVKLGKNVCSDHLIKEDTLSDVILKELNSFISSYQSIDISKELKETYKKKVFKFESTIKSTEKKLIKLQERKYKAINRLLDETISRNEYDNLIAIYNKEKEILSNQIKALKSSLEILTSPSTLEKIASFKKTDSKINELTPEILNKFIEKIEIYENDSLKIHFRF